MRPSFHTPLLLATALLTAAFAVPSARASLTGPYAWRLTGSPRAAGAGVAFADTIEITALGHALLDQFTLAGSGWTVATFADPGAVDLDSSETVRIPFAATPTDPERPLELTLRLDDVTFRVLPFDLSPSLFALAGAQQTLALPEPPLVPAMTDLVLPEPARGSPSIDREPPPSGEDSASPGRATAYNIRVHGRIAYARPDFVIGADGVTVRVWDADVGPDEQLAVVVTDPFGGFDATFSWSNTCSPLLGCDQLPDLYITFETASSGGRVIHPATFDPYVFTTATFANYAGVDLDLGVLGPANEELMPALHQLTSIVRSWRWIQAHAGQTLPAAPVLWPYGDLSMCNGTHIFITGGPRKWDEQDTIHEYGHYVQARWNVDLPHNYCNSFGYGDADPPHDCGHDTWCDESPAVAWNEGWSDWLSDVVVRDYLALYGALPYRGPNHEVAQKCNGSFFASAEKCEGLFANLLRDLEDDTNDLNSGGYFGDRLSGLLTNVLTVSRLDSPLGPLDFVQKLSARYPGIDRERLWETARFNLLTTLDTALPYTPADLHSTSHTAFLSSADPTIDIAWTRPPDDWSGVGSYSISVTSSPALPDETPDEADITTWTSPSLAPGTYWVNVRSSDRAGSWCDSYSTTGPYVVASATPANLTWATPPSWARPSVPRPTADASAGSVPNPTSLVGNVNTTWANLAGRNSGGTITSNGFAWRSRIDGEFGGVGLLSGALAPLTNVTAVNQGPFAVRGGRHVFGMRMDDFDGIAESSESDNDWGHPWVWQPLLLTPNAPVTRSSPPPRTGGWSSVVDGAPLWVNSDGLRFSSATGFWSVAWLAAASPEADYDLNLHFPTAAPDTGFAQPQASSALLAGSLDAVIVNRNIVTTPTQWDAGVVHWSGGGSYSAGQATSAVMAFGDSVWMTMPAGEHAVIREFFLGSGQYGPVTIRVDHDPAGGVLHLAWLRNDFTVGGISGVTQSATTDAAGSARVDFVANTSGWHAALVWRDPVDSNGATVPFVLEIEETLPNPEAHAAPGWAAALVPRSDDLGTPASVEEPVTLTGDLPVTRLNLALREDSPVPMPALHTEIRLDGDPFTTADWTSLGAGGSSLFNGTTAYIVPGGRHTLSWRIDPQGQMEEIDESDNLAGEQWVWTPGLLPTGLPVTLPVPPAPMGGWAEITDDNGGLWFDCSGIRTPLFTSSPSRLGQWAAVSVMSTGGDADVRLHEVATGAHAGFQQNLAVSAWLRDLSDYVVVNFNRTAFRAFDVGWYNVAGSPSPTVEVVLSTYLGSPGEGALFGPFVLGPQQALQLFELALAPQGWQVDLIPDGGGVDWGLTLHPANLQFGGKSSALGDAISWANGADGAETVWADTPIGTYFAVGVWKAGSADLPRTGRYYLSVHPQEATTGVDEQLPSRLALHAPAPNPIRDRARLAFEVPHRSDVALEVFDLRGARVRTLAIGPHEPGRYGAEWDVRGDDGRTVAPGVYLVRLRAGSANELRKLVVAP